MSAQTGHEPSPRSEEEPPAGRLGAVVVAVDGSEQNRSAIDWAANEAAATDRPLVLVLALETKGLWPFSNRDAPDVTELANTPERRVLEAVTDHVSRAHPALAVRHELIPVEGSPAETLVAAAEAEAMLVVGQRGLGAFARVMVGSTSIAVAGRSPVPVVVVPNSWVPKHQDTRPVVVGLQLGDSHLEALPYAALEARRRGVGLVVVHAWSVPPVYAWDATVAAAYEEFGRRQPEEVEEALSGLREEFRDVAITTSVHRGHPATVLLDAAFDGQLLVLGRHGGGRILGFPLGSITRAVLHYAQLPVVVVPATEPQ